MENFLRGFHLFWVLPTLLLSSMVVGRGQALAEEVEEAKEDRFDWSFMTINRYNRDKEKDRIQSLLQLTVKGNLGKGFKVIGGGQTGETFNNGFINLYNFDTKATENAGFHFNKLYLEHVRGRFQTELGAMGVGKSKQVISSFHAFGYLTGGRFERGHPLRKGQGYRGEHRSGPGAGFLPTGF